jgi:hypothetical protein
MPDEKIDQKRPVHAESEIKKMQQRLVDDTVDDSFPASDPPAWTTSGQKSVAATCEPDDEACASQPPAEEGASGAPVRQALEGASDVAREAYRMGQHYIEEGRRRFPEAERYVRQGGRVVVERAQESPIAALLIAGAVGYVLALLIHGRSDGRAGARRGDLPPYGRRPPLNEAQRHAMQGDPRRQRGPVRNSPGAASATANSF